MPDFLKVIVFSASAFVFMFLIAKMLGKDTNWLLNKLQFTKKKQLKNIILAIYDNKNDQIIVHSKND